MHVPVGDVMARAHGHGPMFEDQRREDPQAILVLVAQVHLERAIGSLLLAFSFSRLLARPFAYPFSLSRSHARRNMPFDFPQ